MSKTDTDPYIAPCPCGEQSPTLSWRLGDTFRWRIVSADCCGAWDVEYRTTGYGKHWTKEQEDDEAIEAWNDAPRAKALDSDQPKA